MILSPHPGSAAQVQPDGSDAPLRVLHVIGGLELGGAETLLYRLVTSADGIDHRIICLGTRGWYSDALDRNGIAVDYLGMHSSGSFAAGLPRLSRLVRKYAPDVIQSWLYMSNLLAGIVGRSAGIPVVWGIHGSSFEVLGLPSRACAYLCGLAAPWLSKHVVNCSARSAEVHKRLGYERAPSTVVANGYDPVLFFADDAARNQVRAALAIAADRFTIGAVARWHSQKDIPNLLAALRIVQDRGLHSTCLLVGAGLTPDNSALMSAVSAAGCQNIVRPLGPRPDLAELSRAFDLHVLPSSGGEAFPNVVGETMLAEIPNVVTDVGDSALMAGPAGWVVPPRDPGALADAILAAHGEWRDQPAAWAIRRAKARAAIVDRFTSDKMAAAYRRIWESVSAKIS